MYIKQIHKFIILCFGLEVIYWLLISLPRVSE